MTKEEKLAYNKAYYAAHREELKAKQREWNASHKEEHAAWSKEYRAKNAETIKAKKAEYYQANRPTIDAKGKEWLKSHHRKGRRYCADYTQIEGYDRVLADGLDEFTMSKKWHIHHRFEDMGLSLKDLKEMGLYYNRPACELIIMTNSEHRSHHIKLRNNAR